MFYVLLRLDITFRSGIPVLKKEEKKRGAVPYLALFHLWSSRQLNVQISLKMPI